jgi:glucans biosynthesis protein C
MRNILSMSAQDPAFKGMARQSASSPERRYDIDWLRIMLISSVFLFHIGMFFNSFGWYIKNPERLQWLDPIMVYLHRWRMPLLFLISGAGTCFALGHKSIVHFVCERSRKLLIPLFFGMFFIVPPQIYIEKHAQYNSFLNFIPHIAEGAYPEGNLGWHHLWFVLYLFICATAAIPFILILRSRIGNRIYKAIEKLSSIRSVFLLLSVPLFFSQIFLLKYFPEETHALTDDWAYISYNYLFFLYGYIILSNKALMKNIVEQRRIFAIYALLLSALFFVNWYKSIDPFVSHWGRIFLNCMIGISIALAIVGYAAKYLNHDHPWRQRLNEAIYPFYILHQTAIIVIAFYLVNKDLTVGIKACILASGSLIACSAIYIICIKPFNVARLFFGMHVNTRPSSPAFNNKSK